jgi:MFS family permease
VGITQAAVLVPAVLAGPVAGVYADKLNRRNLMIVGNLFQGGITGAMSVLYLAGFLSFPPLLVLVLLLYTGAQFVRAANNAMIPRIVTKENLGAANGLFTLTSSANQFASYTVGGLVLVTIGAAASITYDSLTFLFAAMMLTFVTKTYGATRPQPPGVGTGGRVGFWDDFREGLTYVRKNRLFIQLVIFGILVNFFGAGVQTLLAPYVKDQLHGDSLAYGLALSSFALGVMVGALAVGKLNFRGYVGKLVILGVMGSGVFTAMAGLAQNVPVALVIFVGIGVLSGLINIPISVLVQTQIPGELLGRAITVLGALLSVALPLSALTFGWLGSLTSTGTLFEISGLAVAVTSVVLYLPFTELRNAKY